MVGTQNTTTSTNTNNTTNMKTLSPAPAKAPLLDCNLCELTFDTAEERRQHAKSEWHVYKLRCKVAGPEANITPPASPSSKSKPKSPSSSEEDSDSESLDEEDIEAIEFTPEECLFCPHKSSDFSSSLTHMSTTHSLSIPYASSLTVDLQTLVWFLHMVISQYRECIGCGKRKRTVEAVRAHMTSLGHCRFDVSEEIGEFYDMEALERQAPEKGSNPDEKTRRLPSGKLLGHRSYSDQNTNRRLREKSPAQSTLPSSGSQQGSSSTSGALTKRDQRDAALTTTLAGLRKGDQMSLMHLPASEQRSLLVRHKKELDKAKRVERKARSKVDRKADFVLSGRERYYKQEVPIPLGG